MLLKHWFSTRNFAHTQLGVDQPKKMIHTYDRDIHIELWCNFWHFIRRIHHLMFSNQYLICSTDLPSAFWFGFHLGIMLFVSEIISRFHVSDSIFTQRTFPHQLCFASDKKGGWIVINYAPFEYQVSYQRYNKL